MGPHESAYTVSHRNIRYPRLEFRTGRLVVILPHGQDPRPIVEKHSRWLERKRAFITASLKRSRKRPMAQRSPTDFRALLDDGIAQSSKRLGVRIRKVFVRTMRTKWASCSPQKNMTVNRLLAHLPERHLRYVVFHEIAHLIERRHNDRFWRLLSRQFKNHRAIEADLLTYWFVLQRRDRIP